MKKPAANQFVSDFQNFWQLASIQIAAVGFSVIIIGQQLSVKYGAGTAICSIAIGNLILWLIAIAIISMVDRFQANAIENFKHYIGKYGGILAALILICAFMNWYAVQINFTMIELTSLFHFDAPGQKAIVIRLGAGLGLFAALFSIGGIRMLRRIAVCSLPLLLFYVIYALWSSNKSIILAGTWGISFSAVLTSILILLPGVINYPTFFRHSRSKAHSFLALTILTILISFFEISTIWMDFSAPQGAAWLARLIVLTIFLILLLTICNLMNIYLASASWEAIVPHLGVGKEYAIIGLFGTLTYTFVQITAPVMFLQALTNAYLACLGIVLLLSYLMRILIKHRQRPHKQIISVSAWLLGCIVATIYKTQSTLQNDTALLAGINASILYFICVIFVEETLWAFRKKTAPKI